MKRGGIFLMIICFSVCIIGLQPANADPVLDIWMTGNFMRTSSFEVQVHRTNTEFGLGSLSYDLQFSESLNLIREYSNYEWVANDGLFDNSDPNDGFAGSFASIRFDTVHDPAGTEFSPGSGYVETFTVELSALTPCWIYFDIYSPAATNGSGVDLITGLGGSLNVIPDNTGHTLGVYIPEPATLILMGVGTVVLLRKRRA